MGSGSAGGLISAGGNLLGGLVGSSNSRDNAEAALAAAQMNWEIANRVQVLEEELFALWRGEYLPMELALNDEIQALPGYQVQYQTAASRAVVEVRRQFSKVRRKTLECMDVHCVGAAVAQIRDLSLHEAMAAGWAASLMHRAEDALKRSLDHQQRQERLGLVQFAHQAYHSTDQTTVAANIADRLMKSSAKSASDQAFGAGYMVAQGIQGILKESGLGVDDKKNPAPSPEQTRTQPFYLQQPSTQQQNQDDDPLAPLLKQLGEMSADDQ